VLSATIWNVRPKRSWAMTLKGLMGVGQPVALL
jgi:hypothetical protein